MFKFDQAHPACTNEEELPVLEEFFQERFIPSAVEMISNEVKIGVTTGRIIAIIGPEYRFMMARLLINDFLAEYKKLIDGYLKRNFESN